MVEMKDIVNAINEECVIIFPEKTVYIDRLPSKFERPSLFIEFLNSYEEDANNSVVKVNQYYMITGYEKVDKHFNSNTFHLIEAQDKILKHFRSGKLKVKDRYLNLKASSSGKDEDVFYISIELEFYDMRNDNVSNEDLISHVQTSIKYKEN